MRYDDYEPEHDTETSEKGKFVTTLVDDEQNDFDVFISYSYTKFLGETTGFECSVTPLGPYVMTIASMKESVSNFLHDETGCKWDESDIIILNQK